MNLKNEFKKMNLKVLGLGIQHSEISPVIHFFLMEGTCKNSCTVLYTWHDCGIHKYYKNMTLYLGGKTPEVCRTVATCELMEGGLSEKDLKVLTADVWAWLIL